MDAAASRMQETTRGGAAPRMCQQFFSRDATISRSMSARKLGPWEIAGPAPKFNRGWDKHAGGSGEKSILDSQRTVSHR